MPLYILCYRFYRSLFLRKSSYLKPSQAVGCSKISLISLTN